jgi:transcriptional regulator with XRE-family HTH domain
MAVEIEPFYRSLGERIQFFRSRRHLTQGELGTRLEPPTTRASIANIEAGKQRVLTHTLIQIAKVLEVEIRELVGAGAQQPDEASAGRVIGELQQKLRISKSAAQKIAAHLNSPSERKLA